MKEWKLLVFLTQLGLSMAAPLGGFLFLGYWLHSRLGWGRWALFLGIGLGILSGIRGLWRSLALLCRMAEQGEEERSGYDNEHR